ncbi:hypothetical protein PAXRUDRAFT_834281 [Paxillus rubicundulus Ve08.2h10]|uniref:Uncharacterized protein n=1 Tax=Paxillus rubicundulus Ve08.2h10 TaxID=930991 RepID=A0A0D0D5Z3_9AGAM|nr:hypothetical protein PAXRUDRAFT_834281 [Paxillus rubicundulus Ve08.2h10]
MASQHHTREPSFPSLPDSADFSEGLFSGQRLNIDIIDPSLSSLAINEKLNNDQTPL